jgi:hypothetical protein
VTRRALTFLIAAFLLWLGFAPAATMELASVSPTRTTYDSSAYAYASSSTPVNGRDEPRSLSIRCVVALADAGPA